MAETETDLLVPRDSLTSERLGAIVTVIGPDGIDCRGRVFRLDGDHALVRVFERMRLPAESHLSISLVQAIPKKERMSFIIQKATELGVSVIHPCISARSPAAVETGRNQDKSHRWSEVARKAVDQCRRRTVPLVSTTVGLDEALSSFSGIDALKIILYEKEGKTRLKDLVATVGRPAAVVLACGPEGGFTEEEATKAALEGFQPVSLGGRVLRCETAALAAIAIVQFAWGDL